jgi:hypothetical protein
MLIGNKHFICFNVMTDDRLKNKNGFELWLKGLKSLGVHCQSIPKLLSQPSSQISNLHPI